MRRLRFLDQTGAAAELEQLLLDELNRLRGRAGERIGDEQRQRRFLREVLVTAGLEHPGIVPVYDAGECAGELYYAMVAVIAPARAACRTRW